MAYSWALTVTSSDRSATVIHRLRPHNCGVLRTGLRTQSSACDGSPIRRAGTPARCDSNAVRGLARLPERRTLRCIRAGAAPAARSAGDFAGLLSRQVTLPR
jgi:hypothetical protein